MDATIISACEAAGVDLPRLACVLDNPGENWGHLVNAFEVLTVLGAVRSAMEDQPRPPIVVAPPRRQSRTRTATPRPFALWGKTGLGHGPGGLGYVSRFSTAARAQAKARQLLAAPDRNGYAYVVLSIENEEGPDPEPRNFVRAGWERHATPFYVGQSPVEVVQPDA